MCSSDLTEDQRETLVFGRLETIPVVVVHGLRVAFFDECIQFLLDERREIQVVVLNPLFLVFTDGDCLPFHRMHIICLVHNILSDCVACEPTTKQCTQDDDGVDESLRDSFAHQKSEISGDAVSPPYCASCPLAWTAMSSENRRFSGSRESLILERLLEEGGLAPSPQKLITGPPYAVP